DPARGLPRRPRSHRCDYGVHPPLQSTGRALYLDRSRGTDSRKSHEVRSCFRVTALATELPSYSQLPGTHSPFPAIRWAFDALEMNPVLAGVAPGRACNDDDITRLAGFLCDAIAAQT